MANTVFDKEEFDKTIKEGVVLVDFYADWCGPCRMLAPYIDKLSSEFQGKAKIIKVNVDATPEIADMYNVRSIPTLILHKEGKQIGTITGFRPIEEIRELINKSFK